MLEASKVSVALERAAFRGLTTTTKVFQALAKASAQGWGASKAIFALHQLDLIPQSHSPDFCKHLIDIQQTSAKQRLLICMVAAKRLLILALELEVWEQ